MAKNESSDTDVSLKFVGWFIPAEIVYLFQDRKLNVKEMLLLATIDSLVDRKLGIGCYASNKWLANSIQLKDSRRIKVMLRKFKKMGLVKQVDFDGRRRYLHTTWTRVKKGKRVGDKNAPHSRG